MGYFIRYFNLLNSRVHDRAKHGFLPMAQLKPLLVAKAAQLRELGRKFVAAFIIASDSEAVTPYINTLSQEVPRMSEECDLVDASGQSLELTNQQGKKTNTSRGGGKGEGSLLVRQIAVARIVEEEMRVKYNPRQTSYQRKRVVGGHNGTEMKAKRLEDTEDDAQHKPRSEYEEW